jgi:hypothetical protein
MIEIDLINMSFDGIYDIFFLCLWQEKRLVVLDDNDIRTYWVVSHEGVD